MKAMLGQQGLAGALIGEKGLPAKLSAEEKAEALEKAHGALILSLGDKPLREVTKETTAADIWKKLEELYMVKSSANRLYLKQRLYSFKMQSGKSVEEHIDEFHKVILDLENVDVKIGDEDQALLLLNSLPKTYENLSDTLLFGKETLTLQDVQSALISKELRRRTEVKEENNSDSLFVKGKHDKKGNKKKQKPWDKDKNKNKCFICKKEGHYKKDCPNKKFKKKSDTDDEGNVSIASECYYDGEVLMATEPPKESYWVIDSDFTHHEISSSSIEGYCDAAVLMATSSIGKDHWVIDSGCSFHMTSNKEWLIGYRQVNGGQVVMGNDTVCKIEGIGSVRLKMEDGTIKILSNVKYVPLSVENVDDTMPSTSFPPLPLKSSEMASKILQQLDKLVSPKEKSSEPRLPNVNDKSPTKLSSSMLRGQALRSMEVVDSSKLLDNVQDIKFHGTSGNLSASAQKLTSKIDKVENGPTKFVSPTDGIPVDSDTTVPGNKVISVVKSGDSFVTEPVSHPSQKKRAFRMSAHEDYLELDEDAYPNGSVSPFSTSGKETTESTSTTVAERSASATEKSVSEMPPGSSTVLSSKSLTANDKLHVRVADGSIVDEKVAAPTPIISSVAADSLLEPTSGAVKASSMHTVLGSDRSTSANGSVANPPLFNFGKKAVTSTDLAGVDAPLKEFTKVGPTFGLDQAAPTKEPGADATAVNFGINKHVDNVPQVPYTFSSSVGGESTGFKFGGASDSKLSSVSSKTAAGAVDSIPKVLELNNADAKSNIVSGFSAGASEPAFSAAASTSLLTPRTSVFTFGNGSNKNNGSAVSSPAFSSPFIFGGSSLASSSSISTTVTSTSAGVTTSTPAVIASSNSSSSAPVVASSSATNSLFKFGSTPLPSTSLRVSSGSEPVETKSGQVAGFGNIGSTSFGGSSAAVGSTGSGIFGFSATATTSVNSQSQGSFVGTTSGSTPGSGFATSNQSQSAAFGSASSPLFGLTGSAAFSSGSSSFPSSSPATNIFNSGTTSGQSTAAPASEANPVSSNNGTSSTSFGISSWQPSKSPFGTSFSSTPSTTGISFGSSTPASTSSSMIFGSSTSASAPQFSFTSAAASTNAQPAFGSSTPTFGFGSASVNNNDQMSMEDTMAEDTVQATPPATPVFGQQPAPAQSNFVFGAPTPTSANPFQFGGQQNIAPQSPSPFDQQNIAPQNPSPFQASGSLEFNAGGNFSLATGGGDKSGRKFVKVKHNRPRKK